MIGCLPLMQTLRLFSDVASLRSFSRAAALHGVTQSAVSQRIHQLEEKLGALLLDRSVRPPALTPAGELFAREARVLVERYDDLTRRVTEIDERLEGEVVVAAIYSAGIDLLQALREGFQRRATRGEDQPSLPTTSSCRPRAVREGACDFGIVSYPRRWPGLAVRALRDERMSLACAPDHPLSSRARVFARDLDGLPMLGLDSGLPMAREIRRYLRSEGVEPDLTNELDNIDTLKNLLAVTDAVAILPRRTVQREASVGVLCVVELEPELKRPIGIVFRRRHGLSRAATSFQDFLVAQADPDAPLEIREESEVSLAS